MTLYFVLEKFFNINNVLNDSTFAHVIAHLLLCGYIHTTANDGCKLKSSKQGSAENVQMTSVHSCNPRVTFL